MKIEELQELLMNVPDREDVQVVLPRPVYAQLLRMVEVAGKALASLGSDDWFVSAGAQSYAKEALAEMERLE